MRIYGNSGNLEGSKILKKTVLSVMTTNLLSQFTWTGKTNRKDVKKFALKDYPQILNLIYEIILAADCSYSRLKYDEDMVQRILKYAYTGQTTNARSTCTTTTLENPNNCDQTSTNSIALRQNTNYTYFSGSTDINSTMSTSNHTIYQYRYVPNSNTLHEQSSSSSSYIPYLEKNI